MDSPRCSFDAERGRDLLSGHAGTEVSIDWMPHPTSTATAAVAWSADGTGILIARMKRSAEHG